MLSRLSQEGSTRKQSYQQQQQQETDDDDHKQHKMDGPESYVEDNNHDHDEHAIADDESDTHPKRSPPHLAHETKKKKKKKRIHRPNNNSRTSLPDSSCQSTPKHSSHYPRKLNKRAQRVLEANLHSHSWSRRESLRQPYEHPVVGLSSDEALQ
jgi:hypothetical protein